MPAVSSHCVHGRGCAHHHPNAHPAALAIGARGTLAAATAAFAWQSALPTTLRLPPTTLRYVLAAPWPQACPSTLLRIYLATRPLSPPFVGVLRGTAGFSVCRDFFVGGAFMFSFFAHLFFWLRGLEHAFCPCCGRPLVVPRRHDFVCPSCGEEV